MAPLAGMILAVPEMREVLSCLHQLQAMANQGTSMKYDGVHQMLGEGDFVLTVSEGQFAGKHVSFYDLVSRSGRPNRRALGDDRGDPAS